MPINYSKNVTSLRTLIFGSICIVKYPSKACQARIDNFSDKSRNPRDIQKKLLPKPHQ